MLQYEQIIRQQIESRVKRLVDTYACSMFVPDRMLISQLIFWNRHESMEFAIGMFLLQAWRQMLIEAAREEIVHEILEGKHDELARLIYTEKSIR